MLERRAFHEFCFVLANPLQVLFDEFPPPFFAVNQDGHAGRYAGQVKLLEIADFDGTVRKVIVGRRLKEECSSPAWGFDPGGACCPPILRWIRAARDVRARRCIEWWLHCWSRTPAKPGDEIAMARENVSGRK